MNVTSPGKGRVAVVDLSASARRSRAVKRGRAHDRVLAHVRAQGRATKEDLLRAFPEIDYPDLVSVVEDLASLGELEVRWTSPFRFVVALRWNEARRRRPGTAALAVA